MKTKKSILSIALLAASQAAFAQASGFGDSIKLSAFGTLAAARTNTDDAELVTSINPTRGVGKTINFSNDSRLGVQLDARITPKLSAVVQAISTRTAFDDNKPQVQFAQLKYEVSPDLSVRCGQIPLAAYLMADDRYVGYAHTTVRPPVELYNTLPFDRVRGCDAIFRTHLEGGTLSLQPMFGNAKWDMFGGHGTNDIVATINAVYETGNWQLRGFYYETRFDFKEPFLKSVYDSFYSAASGNPALVLAARSKDPNKYNRAYFVGASVVYDDGRLLVQGETIWDDTQDIFAAYASSYVVAGYRFGNLMPYAMFSASYKPNKENAAFVPAGKQYDLFRNVVDAYGNGAKQRALSAGLKWNFRPNYDFKLQGDYIMTRKGSNNMFQHAKPDFAGKSVFALTAAVDFVF